MIQRIIQGVGEIVMPGSSLWEWREAICWPVACSSLARQCEKFVYGMPISSLIPGEKKFLHFFNS